MNYAGSIDNWKEWLDWYSQGYRSVSGDFNCSSNELTSLEGCPTSVGGSFHCSWNKLTSLKGCPVSIEGNFICYSNELISLEGCLVSIGGDFRCAGNNLKKDEFYTACVLKGWI